MKQNGKWFVLGLLLLGSSVSLQAQMEFSTGLQLNGATVRTSTDEYYATYHEISSMKSKLNFGGGLHLMLSSEESYFFERLSVNFAKRGYEVLYGDNENSGPYSMYPNTTLGARPLQTDISYMSADFIFEVGIRPASVSVIRPYLALGYAPSLNFKAKETHKMPNGSTVEEKFHFQGFELLSAGYQATVGAQLMLNDYNFAFAEVYGRLSAPPGDVQILGEYPIEMGIKVGVFHTFYQ